MAETHPDLRAVRERRRVKVGLEVQNLPEGRRELHYQRELDETELLLEQRGVPEWLQWFVRKAVDAQRSLLGPERLAQGMEIFQGMAGQAEPTDAALHNIERHLAEMNDRGRNAVGPGGPDHGLGPDPVVEDREGFPGRHVIVVE